jgi:hypothetical protein
MVLIAEWLNVPEDISDMSPYTFLLKIALKTGCNPPRYQNETYEGGRKLLKHDNLQSK